MYFFYCVLFSVTLSCVRLSHFIKEPAALVLCLFQLIWNCLPSTTTSISADWTVEHSRHWYMPASSSCTSINVRLTFLSPRIVTLWVRLYCRFTDLPA